MPQMAPINWLILFLIFSLSFLLFCILNYYSYMPISPKLNNFNKIINSPMNWKW